MVMIPVHMLDHGFSLSCIKGQASCTPSIASSSLSSSLGPRTDTRFWGLRKGSLLLSNLGTLPLLPPSLKKENVRPAFPFLLPFYSICLLSWRSVQKLLASYLCLAVVPPSHLADSLWAASSASDRYLITHSGGQAASAAAC